VLFSRAQERIRREAAESLERLTLGVNNGLAIWSNPDAKRQFERGRARREQAAGGVQTVREFRSTLGRLAAMFPGNVKVH
jgi:hypothetical protein